MSRNCNWHKGGLSHLLSQTLFLKLIITLTMNIMSKHNFEEFLKKCWKKKFTKNFLKKKCWKKSLQKIYLNRVKVLVKAQLCRAIVWHVNLRNKFKNTIASDSVSGKTFRKLFIKFFKRQIIKTLKLTDIRLLIWLLIVISIKIDESQN